MLCEGDGLERQEEGEQGRVLGTRSRGDWQPDHTIMVGWCSQLRAHLFLHGSLFAP